MDGLYLVFENYQVVSIPIGITSRVHSVRLLRPILSTSLLHRRSASAEVVISRHPRARSVDLPTAGSSAVIAARNAFQTDWKPLDTPFCILTDLIFVIPYKRPECA